MITLNKISLQRGQSFLLEQASAVIHPGQKVGLIGKNGCGKSSLFGLLNNILHIDSGDLSVPNHWVIANVKQETPALDQTAIEYVIDGDQEYRALTAQIAAAEEKQQGDKLAALYEKMEHIGGYTIYARAGQLMHGLGFNQTQQSASVADFSGGWRMRLNLAQALICRSDLLLLDEPTNHLDLDAVIWLAKFLNQYAGTLILISHDRDFLDEVCQQICHIEQQKIFSYKGNYSAFEIQRAAKLEQQQALYEKQQREKAHVQSFIDRFKAKASKAKQAQSRVKALAKMEVIAPAHVDSEFNFSFLKPEKNPNPLIALDKVSAGYPDKTILETVQLNLVPGSRIGLLGRNGAGKSTLIKLLAGDIQAKAGEVTHAAGLNIGYFAQHQLEQLRPQDSPLQHLTRLANNETEQVLRDHLGGFGFSGDQALSEIANFSGGEKARLVLALLVWQKPNLLLLDEPTNHLDLDMRFALTLALQEYQGAMIIVSHDRHILRSTCDDFYLVDSGRVSAFEGDLEDYEAWLTEQNKAETSSDSSSTKANSASNKKEQKRREAEFRQATKPLRQKIEKLSKQTDTLQQKLDEIEAQLADSDIYASENKAKLTELLKQQAQIKPELEQTEEAWLELEEELEQRQAEFDSQAS
ncbi:ABC transporter ATP-binding protein [Catenovulum maritimum]|uniref:Probable ATP-binding protein YheS n=1 Tax=Catenovulum maritimum TaxID=1513271 RepID=A0A0J8GUV5_9ALTE|nr:ABC transporter ATP-binding protein [Catenovulum maritimum]KMT65074.1 ABC transporter ATP-binding protein [Catenovulum maritimum]